MQEKRLSRILGIYRSNPSGSVLKVWKSYPESFYKKLVNKRFFLKIRDNPTFGITNFFFEKMNLTFQMLPAIISVVYISDIYH